MRSLPCATSGCEVSGIGRVQRHVIDHYWCPHGNVGLPTLIQRYGSGAHQYLTMPVKVCHPQHSRLRQTYAMAQNLYAK